MAHRYHAPVLVVLNDHEVIASGLEAAGFDIARAADAAVFPGAFDALVHVPDLAAAVRAPVVDLDDAAWDARGEALLRAALHACRAGHTAMRDRGGRIVLVTPTVGLVGADGLAPFTMACEGMRTLAKAAARQWGSAGITANCVAPSLDVFGIAHDARGSVAPTLGRSPRIADLVTVIVSLLGTRVRSSRARRSPSTAGW